MIQTLLRISWLLFGYAVTGIGVLVLLAYFKFMLDLLPELLVAQAVGLALTASGLWVLGKYDKGRR